MIWTHAGRNDVFNFGPHSSDGAKSPLLCINTTLCKRNNINLVVQKYTEPGSNEHNARLPSFVLLTLATKLRHFVYMGILDIIIIFDLKNCKIVCLYSNSISLFKYRLPRHNYDNKEIIHANFNFKRIVFKICLKSNCCDFCSTECVFFEFINRQGKLFN